MDVDSLQIGPTNLSHKRNIMLIGNNGTGLPPWAQNGQATGTWLTFRTQIERCIVQNKQYTLSYKYTYKYIAFILMSYPYLQELSLFSWAIFIFMSYLDFHEPSWFSWAILTIEKHFSDSVRRNWNGSLLFLTITSCGYLSYTHALLFIFSCDRNGIA